MVKTKPMFGALPVIINMPSKSHDKAEKENPRVKRSLVQNYESSSVETYFYDFFKMCCCRVQKLKSLKDWIIEIVTDRALIKKCNKQFLVSMFEIQIDDSFTLTISVYAWFLAANHESTKLTNNQ